MGRGQTPTSQEVLGTAEVVAAMGIAREAAKRIVDYRKGRGYTASEAAKIVEEFREVICEGLWLRKGGAGDSGARSSGLDRDRGEGRSVEEARTKSLVRIGEFPDSPEDKASVPSSSAPSPSETPSLPLPPSGAFVKKGQKLLDVYGNEVKRTVNLYILLKCPPGTATPGLYRCNWEHFKEAVAAPNGNLPAPGYFYWRVSSVKEAQEKWEAHGHPGTAGWVLE